MNISKLCAYTLHGNIWMNRFVYKSCISQILLFFMLILIFFMSLLYVSQWAHLLSVVDCYNLHTIPNRFKQICATQNQNIIDKVNMMSFNNWLCKQSPGKMKKTTTHISIPFLACNSKERREQHEQKLLMDKLMESNGQQ